MIKIHKLLLLIIIRTQEVYKFMNSCIVAVYSEERRKIIE